MATLTDLATREVELPPTAPVADVLLLADEVQAFAVGERNVDQEIVTRLLARCARRISPSTPNNLAAANRVLSLALAGLTADKANKARDAAYQAAYEQVREAVAAGMTEVEAARVSGFDRMTIRRALGKPRKKTKTEPTMQALEAFAEVFEFEETDEPEMVLADPKANRPKF